MKAFTAANNYTILAKEKTDIMDDEYLTLSSRGNDVLINQGFPYLSRIKAVDRTEATSENTVQPNTTLVFLDQDS